MMIPKGVKKTIEILNKNGFEAYIAGGAVRDFLMGKTPKDYDIATNALPSETKECLKDFKTYDTGIKHGTVKAVVYETEIEITTYRIDGKYTDFRRPDNVVFSKNLEEDLKRRDFTVNAMAFDGQNLVDIFGGKDDIKNKIIRCVGQPDVRFQEDALRMMRALRFSSVFNFKIEENTAKSIIKNTKLISRVSAERKFEEFKKLIQGENAAPVIEQFEYFLKEAVKITSFKLKGDNIYQKFASLYKTGEDAEKSLASLKADKKTQNFVTKLVKYRDKKLNKTLLNSWGEEFSEIFDKETAHNLLKSGECIFLKDLNIKGNDLKEMGFKGKEIKTVLNTLLERVHQNNELNKAYILKEKALEIKNENNKK